MRERVCHTAERGKRYILTTTGGDRLGGLRLPGCMDAADRPQSLIVAGEDVEGVRSGGDQAGGRPRCKGPTTNIQCQECHRCRCDWRAPAKVPMRDKRTRTTRKREQVR